VVEQQVYRRSDHVHHQDPREEVDDSPLELGDPRREVGA